MLPHCLVLGVHCSTGSFSFLFALPAFRQSGFGASGLIHLRLTSMVCAVADLGLVAGVGTATSPPEENATNAVPTSLVNSTAVVGVRVWVGGGDRTLTIGSAPTRIVPTGTLHGGPTASDATHVRKLLSFSISHCHEVAG
jgi:hypothetical protein